MTRAIVAAGLLGGLLGGLLAVAAGRLFPTLPEPAKYDLPAQASAGSPEARAVAEAFLGKLRAMKYDEFVGDVKQGMTFLSEPEYEAFKKSFLESRVVYHGAFGKLTGEYELVRETALRSDLVRLVYLEKFERGAVAWVFIMYKTQHGWRLNGIVWNKDLIHAFPGGS